MIDAKKQEMYAQSWWNRTLPVVDLDAGQNGKWPEYEMSEKDWIKSVKKDLNKVVSQAVEEDRRKLVSALKEIVWMARRYASGRQTYAPSMFNDAYDVLRELLGDDIDSHFARDMAENTYYDITLEHTTEHPYALDKYDKLQSRKFYKKPAKFLKKEE